MSSKAKNEPRVLEDIKQQVELQQQQEDAAAPEESKAQAFQRIAQLRMTNTLDEIRKLGNLSNRSIYEYNGEQIDKMERAIYARLDEVFKKLRHVKRGSDEFRF